jgi:hypothetical protein
MPKPSRDHVNQSTHAKGGARTHVSQAPARRDSLKTPASAGRDAVNQSPSPNTATK